MQLCVPEKHFLKEYYQRRCAVILKRNNPGADIMIPVKLSEDRYSYILIQVKNYTSSYRSSDKDYPESGSSKLSSRFVFQKSDLKDHGEQYVTSYWQLGFQGQLREVPPIRTSKRQKIEQQLQHPFAHFGLNFFAFLDPSVKEELADLLDAFHPLMRRGRFTPRIQATIGLNNRSWLKIPLFMEFSISLLPMNCLFNQT
jgi:hypothetical protein